MENQLRCSKCNEMKDATGFRKHCNICRECRNEATKQWRLKNVDYHSNYYWNKVKPVKVIMEYGNNQLDIEPLPE